MILARVTAGRTEARYSPRAGKGGAERRVESEAPAGCLFHESDLRDIDSELKGLRT